MSSQKLQLAGYRKWSGFHLVGNLFKLFKQKNYGFRKQPHTKIDQLLIRSTFFKKGHPFKKKNLGLIFPIWKLHGSWQLPDSHGESGGPALNNKGPAPTRRTNPTTSWRIGCQPPWVFPPRILGFSVAQKKTSITSCLRGNFEFLLGELFFKQWTKMSQKMTLEERCYPTSCS